MKKIYFILGFLISVLSVSLSQVVPKGMNYQAIARSLNGEILANQRVSLRITLLSMDGQFRVSHYSEVHDVVTSETGLFDMIVGEGNKEQGEYGLIPWNSEDIWMEVAIYDKRKTEFAKVSSSRLMAVPYAMHAGSAERLSEKINNPTSNFAPPEPGVISDTWSVFGNSKTDAAGNPYHINALGTTDLVDLIMITNNIERLRILKGGDIETQQNFEVGKNLQVGENLFVGGSASVGDSLKVKKNVLLNTEEGSTINYGAFTVDSQSHTALTGTLTVDKATDLNSTLNVDGNTNINARLFVNNLAPSILSGTLQVDSVTNINDAFFVNNMSPAHFSGTLRVDKDATFQDKLKILSTFSTDTSGSAPSGSLQVNGGAYIKENFYVGGVAKFGGPVAFGGAVSIFDLTQSTTPSTGALKVSGGVGIGLNLNVGEMIMINGMTTIKDETESVDTLTGALKVFGGVGINKRLNVQGAVSLFNSLRVIGPSYLNSSLTVSSSKNFIGHFTNTSDRHGISIQINTGTPVKTNNYVEFRNSNDAVVGRIEGENAAESILNSGYILQLNGLNTTKSLAEIAIVVASIQVAGAVAGVVAAAASTTTCAGLGVCQTVPIISLIVKAALDLVAKGILLGTATARLVNANNRISDFTTYKAARIGVTYESGNGDYAEWLPKKDLAEKFMPGQIVTIKDGMITKNIEGGGKLLVISTHPIVLGNMPEKGKETSYEKVAFLGQVPVHVLGKVNVGDYILPSGNNDGFGRGVAPGEMKMEDYSIIVGVAWTGSINKSYNLINVALGLYDGDISKSVVDQNNKIIDFRSKFDESNRILSSLVPAYGALRSKNGISSQQAVASILSKNMAPNFNVDALKIGDFNYAEITGEQIMDMINSAEKLVVEYGGNTDNLFFWKQLKTDVGYKETFIKDMQNIYKTEIRNQFEKIAPGLK